MVVGSCARAALWTCGRSTTLTTLVILLFAHRMHFVRVGAAVVMLHDATEPPIDFLVGSRRRSRSSPPSPRRRAARPHAGSQRGYAFPCFIIWSALTRTAPMRAYDSTRSQSIIAVGRRAADRTARGHQPARTPWLRMLATKVRQIVARTSRARLGRRAPPPSCVVALRRRAFDASLRE